ncbi:MAG TPA: hypothetical protein VF557_10295 [Jatrophihabitans sp.]|jgi:hypothetical protein|uniref:hypothetical protein n=1 Tax=Jatrophihabitans sp. TaxID=1932789 RepID=UPI002EE0A391
MNTNKMKAGVIGVALVGGTALALLSPSSPAVAYYSGGLHLDVTPLSPASLVSRGAAVDVPVDVYCNATYAEVYLRVTERVGSATAVGATYQRVSCTGSHQRILMRVTASPGKAFAKGTAVATAEIWGCRNHCGDEMNSVTIEITR